jgi:hypothetical protein
MVGSSAGTFPTPSDGVGNIKVEEDEEVMEEADVCVKQEEIPEDITFPDIKSEPHETDTGIKQEEFPEDITFSDIKSESDEVSYVCVCLLLGRFYCVQKYHSSL